jgi:hypothetical protein
VTIVQLKVYINCKFNDIEADITQLQSKANMFFMIKTGYKKGLSTVGSKSSEHPTGSTPSSPLSD